MRGERRVKVARELYRWATLNIGLPKQHPCHKVSEWENKNRSLLE